VINTEDRIVGVICVNPTSLTLPGPEVSKGLCPSPGPGGKLFLREAKQMRGTECPKNHLTETKFIKKQDWKYRGFKLGLVGFGAESNRMAIFFLNFNMHGKGIGII
jgi:hypothetical protein